MCTRGKKRAREEKQATDPCTVCLGEPKQDETALDNCCHTFCQACIAQWLSVRRECPLCKARTEHTTSRATGKRTKFTTADELRVAEYDSWQREMLHFMAQIAERGHDPGYRLARTARLAIDPDTNTVSTSGDGPAIQIVERRRWPAVDDDSYDGDDDTETLAPIQWNFVPFGDDAVLETGAPRVTHTYVHRSVGLAALGRASPSQ